MTTTTVNAPDSRQAMGRARELLGDSVTILASARQADGSVTVVVSNDPTAVHSQETVVPANSLAQPSATPVADVPEDLRRSLATGIHGYAQVAAANAAATSGGAVARANVAFRTVAGAVRSGLQSALRAAARRTTVPQAETFGAAMTAATPAVNLAAGTDQNDPAVNRMRDELSSMRRMIERELGNLSSDRLRASRPRARAIDLLTEFGCDSKLAHHIAGQVNTNTGDSVLVPVVRALLATAIPVTGRDLLADGGVIALVGPTGAGKTTTAAKLAALFASQHSPRDVALVTTDMQRAAAREQLQAHGMRLGITVVEASGRKGLAEALKNLAGYPLVIVDTAGLSPKDKALINQLNLLKASDRVRTLLVAPANSNARDLSDLVRVYAAARPDGLVLTKVDETSRIGGAISVAVKHELPIAFTGDGQAVHGNIAVASADALSAELLEIVVEEGQDSEEQHAAA